LNRNQRLAEGGRLAADERIAVIRLAEGGNKGVLVASRAGLLPCRATPAKFLKKNLKKALRKVT